MFADCSIGAFQVGLQQTNSNGYIAGVQEVNLPSSGSSAALDVVFSTASSLLGCLPSPYGQGASVIMSLLDNVNATTTYQISGFTDHNNIHCTLGLWDQFKLDDSPLPIVFQLADSSSSTITFQGNAYIDLTYAVDLLNSSFYVRTTRANVGVSMSV